MKRKILLIYIINLILYNTFTYTIILGSCLEISNNFILIDKFMACVADNRTRWQRSRCKEVYTTPHCSDNSSPAPSSRGSQPPSFCNLRGLTPRCLSTDSLCCTCTRPSSSPRLLRNTFRYC